MANQSVTTTGNILYLNCHFYAVEGDLIASRTIDYCCKNATILSLSLSVSNARVCICIPIVFHCSGEKVLGEGVLWHR
jgi:hypothetical protein